jgi:hypothetical protein
MAHPGRQGHRPAGPLLGVDLPPEHAPYRNRQGTTIGRGAGLPAAGHHVREPAVPAGHHSDQI